MNRTLLGVLVLCLVVGGVRPPGIVGQLFVYPWLGLFPGLALAFRLLPRTSGAVRIAVGLTVSPLLAAGAAWFLIRWGLPFTSAALVVAMAGWLGCLAAALSPSQAELESPALPHGALMWAVGLAVVLIAVPSINPYIFVRGDSWLHGAFVMEILERGFPPQDPRMAGLQLNYVWFFNFFIALLTSIHRQDLFRFMTLLNAAVGFSIVVLAADTAARIWKNPPLALPTAALLTLGLNAGTFLLWPLHLVRMWTGQVQGWPELMRQIGHIEWGRARIIYSLSAPFADMVSFLDKLLVGTAIHLSYVQMTLATWALVRWLGNGSRDALVWIAIASAGMIFFHSVVGLSVVPILVGVLALAWLLRARWSWLPSRGRLLAPAFAAVAGVACALPYLRSISSGWSPEKAGFEHHFVEFMPVMPWTLFTAAFFPIVLLRPSLAAIWPRRQAIPLLLTAVAAGLAVYACVVHLPGHNSIKFVYEFLAFCSLVVVPVFAERAVALWRRSRWRAVAVGLMFVLPTAFTLQGYASDPTGRTRPELHPRPGEEALYYWLRQETPDDAVVVDRNFRDLIAVKARRRLYLGTDQPPDLAAFPAPEMRKRQHVMADLYGPMAQPDSVVETLRSLGPPIYVVYRPEDPLVIEAPWQRFLEHAREARLVYEFDGYHVVLLPARTSL